MKPEPDRAASPSGRPRVGVVVPCFNQGRYAWESVSSALAQDYPNLEVVLLDDASTDDASTGLCRALAGPRVKVVCLERNLGRALVRNRGLAELGAVDFVLVLDCDDVLSSGYVSALVSAMEEDPLAGVAYGTLHSFGTIRGCDVNGSWPRRGWVASEMYLENAIPGPGALFRKKALDTTEGWRAAFTQCGGEDFDISLQVLERGWRPIWVREAVFHYRQHDASSLATKSPDRRRMVDLLILEKHLPGIRSSCGTEAYVKRTLLPYVLSGLRHGDRRTLAVFLPRLILSCPVATASLILRHVFRRWGGS